MVASYNVAVLTIRAHLSALLRNPTLLALGVVLIAALSLRLYNLDWDHGQYLHPDERFIADVSTSRVVIEWPPDISNLLDPENSRLNPRSDDPNTGLPRDFSYGALPLIVTDLAGSAMTKLTEDDWSTYSGGIYKVGRFLSAIFDTLTVLVVFLIGRRVAGTNVGLFAAAIAAMTPMAIQLAHFFTTDSWLTFFVSLTLLFSMRAIDAGERRWFLLSGVGFGLALATKGSVFTLAAVVAVAIVLAAWQRRRRFRNILDGIAWMAERAVIAMLGALAAFALFEPYALWRPATYIDQLLNQSRIIRGEFDVPFTRQYIGTTPIIYQIEQVVRWGYGPVAALLIAIGAVTLIRRLVANSDYAALLLLAWFAGYGIVIALPETKFLRYLAPLLPVFAVFAGLAIESIRSWLARLGWKRIAAVAPAALLIGVGLWTAAFMNVYAQTNPRIAASEWMYANVPPGSVIAAEYWDDSLPLDLSASLNPGAFNYSWVSFNLYADPPAPEAAAIIYEYISSVDYIAISSNRVISAMPQSPWRYPVQAEYYRLLQAEQLGFKLVAEFQIMPELGPFAFDDRNADESFINYDHPRVLIFQKTEQIPRFEYDALMAWATSQPVTPARHPVEDSILLSEPVSSLPVVDDARWSAGVTGNSLVALSGWIAFVLLLQVAGLPIALLAFRRFADRGWAFARLTSLLIAGWLVWILASLEVIEFRVFWCWMALGVLLLPWLFWRRQLGSAIRATWHDRAISRTILIGEALFWGIFALFLLFRYLNPDSWHPYWGGEKPMEFAHINAILRSAHFPPYDPWFSDGYINYYYYGMYLVAFMFKATGIPSEIAFNLAQPTVIAMLALAGYGLSATLGRSIARSRRSAPVIGLVGAVVLVLIGNLTAAVRIVQALPDRPLPSFIEWFWGGSRVITFFDARFGNAQQISEFPYFTAVFADLHAHVVALPISVMALALGVAVAKEARPIASAVARWEFRPALPALSLTLFAAFVVGTLFPTNAWDFFTYAAFMAGSLFIAFRYLSPLPRIVGTGIAAALLVGIGYGLYLPFHRNFVALFSSIKSSEQRTDTWQFSQHFGGIFLLAFVGLTALVWTRMTPERSSLTPTHAVRSLVLLLSVIAALALLTDMEAAWISALFVVGVAALALANGAWWSVPAPGMLGRYWNRHMMAIGAVLTLGAVLDDRLVLGLSLALALMSAAIFFGISGTSEKAVALMATAGFAIPGMVELIYVVDDLDGGSWERMNTMFKFYNQVWVLLAIAAGALIGWLLWEAVHRPQIVHARLPFRTFSPTSMLIVIAAVITASLAYPITATVPRLEQRFEDRLGSGTLNALDWMNDATLRLPNGEVIAFADDLAAINWLNDNVTGTPVIVEASIGAYRGNGSRISIATGLPTVLGWERHQQQQRYVADSAVRFRDVREFYRTASVEEKLAFLQLYGVTYVVVGDIERYAVIGENPRDSYSTLEGIAAFDEMVGNGLEIAFQHGTTTIYRVVTTSQPVTGGTS